MEVGKLLLQGLLKQVIKALSPLQVCISLKTICTHVQICFLKGILKFIQSPLFAEKIKSNLQINTALFLLRFPTPALG